MGVVSQFNARNASASQIAKGFVVPFYFHEVTPYRNVILVGPRGIGKTTLLKALTAPGLTVLHRRPELKEALAGTDFEYVPLYIPAESVWKGTTGLVKDEIDNSGDQELILGGLFTDHCLYQVIVSFEEAIAQHADIQLGEKLPWAANISSDSEAKICANCSDLWGLKDIQKSFLGVKLELLKRSNLYRAAIDGRSGITAMEEVRKTGRIDFLLMLKGFFDIVEAYSGIKRWTVSFDEMEIAPRQILAHLYQNLRSFDQRAALKFSLFPYVDFYEERGGFVPSQGDPDYGNDFHTVVLSNKFSNLRSDFSRDLITSECERRGVSFGEFMKHLNGSRAIITNSRVYSERGFERNPRQIYDHILKNVGDSGFIKHLEGKGIKSVEDIDNLKGENTRASLIRKTFPIAEIRAYYFSKSSPLSSGTSKVRRSSAKGYGYYHGYNQLLALTEGNPRAIKYYLNDLLDDMELGKDSARSQNAAIPQNVNRFRAMVASQSVPSNEHLSGEPGALKLVDALGFYLAEGLLSETFHPEPPLSFRLVNIHPSLKEGLVSAVNSGALIVEESASDRKILFDLEGCRVRISHRLAPYYKLPTITGQERRISNLPENKMAASSQPDLLTWREKDD